MTTRRQTKKNSPGESSPPLPRLNLGAGEQRLEGYTNVDLSAGIDLGQFPWPWADASVREIMASHILEHFTKADAYQFLSECHRVLAPGGRLYLAVPDLDIFVGCQLADDWTDVGDYPWRNFEWFFGGGTREPRPEMRHRYAYNYETLVYMCEVCGFEAAYKRPPLPEDNPRYHQISLYVTAVKG